MPLFFFVLSIIGISVSGLSPSFVLNETVNRFVRNGVMIFALIIPIKAGMGLNFSVTVGAMCAQMGYIIAIAAGLGGKLGGVAALSLSLTFAIVFGVLIGHCLNQVPGKEMITTMIIGFLANGFYQLIFLVCVGSIIPVKNTEILLSRGTGVRNLIDLEPFRGVLDKIFVVTLHDISFPMFMIGVVLFFGAFINYLMHTPFGKEIKCVGDSSDRAYMVGINSKKVRIKAIVLSTVVASLGHMIYLQNIGMLNVYTGHLKHEIFASAALMAGGATIKDATVRQGILGLLVFHTLFIVSPQAGQQLFDNPALGEYFRSFIAYGTIALALIVNLKNSETV
ncbi:MAG: ABC transporter permease [Clostridia bacterium]|nr:ABC transporter permease [Clostridia bacterium]